MLAYYLASKGRYKLTNENIYTEILNHVVGWRHGGLMVSVSSSAD